MGGNLENLPDIGGATNLHAAWDSVIYSYCGYATLVSAFFLLFFNKREVFEFFFF